MRKAAAAAALLIFLQAGLFAQVTLKQDDASVTFFDASGKQIAKQVLDENENVVSTEGAIPDGKVLEYDDNGKIAGEYQYRGGLREGTARQFYESGKPYAEISYVKGVQEGVAKYFHENGKVMAEFTFKSGQREGMGRGYDLNGRLDWDASYRAGYLEGTSAEYYPNGKPAVVKTFSAGRFTGKKAYESGGALLKEKKVALYKEAAVDVLPQSVSEFGDGKYMQISKLSLGKNGLSGSLQLDWIQETGFILAICVKTASQFIVFYKDAEMELTGAYELGGDLTPLFSSRGYALKGGGKKLTVTFEVSGSASGIYDVTGGPKTVTVFCLKGSVNPHYFPSADSDSLGGISNVLTASVK